MGKNYFRNNPTDGALGVLGSRKTLWKQGQQKTHIKDAYRNNAWVSVTIDGLTLPKHDDKFGQVYGRGPGSPKPYPSLTSVVITTAGMDRDWETHALFLYAS